ncbi:hypothetical protein ARMSODRAFT_976325 [Armillaria solidipes]|uniref:Uncharacterized protein n=1 Tax=Armillaria solidipes TaxID=1076256 RepID=A0A2H3BGK7_9AGAR|nr:hypothetical protein ARMSODRAFT_976325 [Armillaria solidipes]
MDMGDLNAFFRESADVAPVYYFDQLIDHDDPSKGTFKQRYWHNAEFYKEGGPIMQAKSMRAVLYPVSLIRLLQLLDNQWSRRTKFELAQAIEDHVYFAQNVGTTVIVLVRITCRGSCYSGGLVFVDVGLTYTHSDFWQYFEPIRENMPRNCSADVEAVIAYIDELSVRWNLWSWQELQPTTGSETAFYRFCDALEVKDGVSASVNGWGMDHALSAWARSSNPDTALEARADHPAYHSWLWLKRASYHSRTLYILWGFCGEIKLMDIIEMDRRERACVVEFPDAFHTILVPNGDSINAPYGGWGVKNRRLFFANGKCEGDGVCCE